MTIKALKNGPKMHSDCVLIEGRFVPNGTSNPTSSVTTGKGVATVTYNGAAGCWRVTINVPISSMIAPQAWILDDKTQVQSYECNVVAFSDANQTFDIELQYAADVNAGAYAAYADDNSVQYICWRVSAHERDVPGDGT